MDARTRPDAHSHTGYRSTTAGMAVRARAHGVAMGLGIGPVTRGISVRPIRGVALAWRGACSHRESLCCATLMMVLADR